MHVLANHGIPDARGEPFTQDVSRVLLSLDTCAGGLDEAEAARRLNEVGPNRVDPPAPASALAILLDQLRSVVVLLLLAAALVSLAFGDLIEAAAIASVLVINAALGFVVELRARRAMEALLAMDVMRAFVLRDGRPQSVDSQQLVPGDVVELGPGQTVPADGRLVIATDLRTNEAALTGESLPVSKEADLVLASETPLADRRNMVYKGTTVAAGAARAVVTATGRLTEFGRIGLLVGGIREERTPLERRLDALGHRLVWVTLAVAAAVGALGVLQGAPPAIMLETAIALAVAAVPEGLPAVATIALAIGLRRMARRHALVRRLPAVESLGSTTIVCTDKTRTLTSGDMTVVCVRSWDATFDLRDDLAARAQPTGQLDRIIATAVLASRPQADGRDHGARRSRRCRDAARRAGSRHRAARSRLGSTRRRADSVLERTEADGVLPSARLGPRGVRERRAAPRARSMHASPDPRR